MPPSTGQKRQRQPVAPTGNSLITKYYQPQSKRQDTKKSPNNENEVSFDQLKKEIHSPRRALGDKSLHPNNKKAIHRQPLQQIGGLETNTNLNTGLKNNAPTEPREQWCVYSDPPEENDNVRTFTVFEDVDDNDKGVENNKHDDDGNYKKKQQCVLGKGENKSTPTHSRQQQENNKNNQQTDDENEQTHNNDSDDSDRRCAALSTPLRPATFHPSDNEESDDDDDQLKGFFDDDDDDDDILITKTRRPKRLGMSSSSRQLLPQVQNDYDDLVPQFSIPAPSPVLDEPLVVSTDNHNPDDINNNEEEDNDGDRQNIPIEVSASFPPLFTSSVSDVDDDEQQQENDIVPLFEASASFPPLFTGSCDEDGDDNDDIEQQQQKSVPSSSVEKQDSKLDNSEKPAESDITTMDNSSSLANESHSLDATIPIVPNEQFEAHVPYPFPRGKTLLEKFGIEKIHSDTSTNSGSSSTTLSPKGKQASFTGPQDLEEESSLSATIPMNPIEQFEAHVPYPVPRGKNLLEKLGIQNEKDVH
ncbi:hypothetical protein BDA99DRAFT_511470 [Phascolomyces articulosus]|uniref:Uncharacterized protein n=1 Tax=Phascolomyces articulosus TaxID=60185 RepID=A0AAD5JZ73_9FUNG|nr:hypothetical protein BDA99DRAFT_511470 [Phascolomyces articulosus]